MLKYEAEPKQHVVFVFQSIPLYMSTVGLYDCMCVCAQRKVGSEERC